MPAKKAPRNKRKTAAKTPGRVALVPQPHGGSLHVGGVPGNRGGGRLPSEVKAAALLAFDDRLPVLSSIADDTTASNADRISAVDKLGKYGLGDGISRAEVRKALSATIGIFRDNLSPDEADAILAAIKPYWSAL